MHEILVPLTNYLLSLAAGAALSLVALIFWRDWRRAADVDPAPPAAAVPPARRRIGYVLVDAPYVTEFIRDNPEMLTADQCRHALGSFADAPVYWLSRFNQLLSKATLDRPEKVPVFYLRRGYS